MISKKPAAVNRTCQACKISKIKCDVASVGDNERCSRCERLNLHCVRVARGNDGSARLSAPGVCALRVERSSSSSSSALATSESSTKTEIQMLKRFFSRAQSSKSKQVLRAILRWCSQIAWSHDETGLMAWVLAQAARCGLPLSDFAPIAIGKPLDAPGTPPPFVGEILGRSGLGVAFVAMDRCTLWTANDDFDQEVCTRRELHESHTQPTCKVCTHFSPDDEILPFETKVIGPLVAALAPTPTSDGDASDEDASDEALPAGALLAGGSAVQGSASAAEGAASQQASDLQSEVVDSTSMWRIYMRSIDAYVCCTVVFRCALLRDGTMWVVGSYQPIRAVDGAWVTERVTERPEAAKPAPPGRLTGPAQGQDPPPPAEHEPEPGGGGRRAKAARRCTVGAGVDAPGAGGTGSLAEATQVAVAGSSAPAEFDGEQPLEEQLELMSANELLSLF